MNLDDLISEVRSLHTILRTRETLFFPMSGAIYDQIELRRKSMLWCDVLIDALKGSDPIANFNRAMDNYRAHQPDFSDEMMDMLFDVLNIRTRDELSAILKTVEL